MTQTLKPWNPHEIEIPPHLIADDDGVAKIISDFNSNGSIPDITITESGQLIDGVNALEAAKRLDQGVIIAIVTTATTEEKIQIQWIPIELLDPHPINTQIYGENEDVAELAESIAKNGLQEVFTVTPNADRFTIIHGHRRRLACIKAGLTKVPAKVKNFSTSEDAIAALLSGNEYREKSIEQKAREYLAWEEIEKQRAKSRQGRTGEGQGTTRDIIAKRVGLGSGVNAEHAVAAVKALDEVKDPVKKSQLKMALSKPRGVDAAYKLVKPSEQKQFSRWIPKEGDKVRIVKGRYKDKLATVTVVLSLCALCHVEGNPEAKRDQIPFTDMELVEEVIKPVTSIQQEVKQQQNDLGLGNRAQVLPDIKRNTGIAPVEQMQSSATNLNVVGDSLVTEVAIALIKLSPKQMGEVFAKIEDDLSTQQLEAIWQSLRNHFAHKAA
ncbi:ParB/RepB/Spo0J family partition protein [Aulosira sp. FACHB-615]|uniref:ParB/RepB/Spo0J family partition protein n=1 Tax=Aulosira sp. FACHB-615 TaxID=2692777 RepID=UPI0016883379|nr:ParB N-terminal domain-containing protein [Aulosira sp. FACHB-615]MBD2488984.1 ParB N-terminal domain-containing protein [Aulosira sp. FACHB-615]